MKEAVKINRKELIGRKARISYLEIFILVLSTFAFAWMIASISEVKPVKAEELTNCCQEDKYGRLGVDYPATTCNSECTKTCLPTKCSELSDYQIGCCYDAEEGICSVNSPKATCIKEQGKWEESEDCNINSVLECKLGCCVLGGNTQLVTSRRCEKLSAELGLNTDFRSALNTEFSCLALAQAQKKGACVLEGGGCKMLTGQECLSLTGKNNNFFESVLCTSSLLNTTCKKTEETTCVDGKDEVYFQDSCGNPANIYDISQINNNSYWERIIGKENSCNANSGNGNANSKTCGNCNYYLGSKCKDYKKTETKPDKGNYICSDLSCKNAPANVGKQDRRNGESWCVYDGSIGVVENRFSSDVVGSRHFKYLCVEGEVKSEPCADFRNEICVQTDTSTNAGVFSSASCRINQWQKCINSNANKDGCQGLDCFVKKVNVDKGFKFDMCAPKYPEGFDLSTEAGGKAAEQICGMATQSCTVIYIKDMKGSCNCEQNCNCEKSGFTQQMNDLCISLGDCGGKANILGEVTDGGYTVSNAPKILLEQYKKYATAVAGQKAEPGTIQQLVGNLTSIQELGEPEGSKEKEADIMTGLGIAGAGLIIDYMNGGTALSSLTKGIIGGGGSAASAGATGALGATGVIGATGAAGAAGTSGAYQTGNAAIRAAGYGRISNGANVQGVISGYDSGYFGRPILSVTSGPYQGNYIYSPEGKDAAARLALGEKIGTPINARGYELIKLPPADATPIQAAATQVSVAAEQAEIAAATAEKIATEMSNAAASGVEDIGFALEEAQVQAEIAAEAATKVENIAAEFLGEEVTSGLGDMTADYAAEQVALAADYAAEGEAAVQAATDIAAEAGVAIEPEAISSAVDSSLATSTTETITTAPITAGVTPGAIISAFANVLVVAGIIMTIAPLILRMLGIQTTQTGMIAGTIAGTATTVGYAAYTAASIVADLNAVVGGATVASGATAGAVDFMAFFNMLLNPFSGAFAWTGLIIGIIVAVIIMSLFKFMGVGKVCKKVIVTYTCKPWQPPVGGADCGKCTQDPLKTCSKYRCKSLGQACEFFNEGTSRETCAAVADNGHAPVISPWYEILNGNFSYVNVSEKGFQIREKNGNCIEVFTPFLFGIKTDKISQCKLDVVSKTKYEDMSEYFGDSNLFLQNHSMGFSMPSKDVIADEFELNTSDAEVKFLLDKLGSIRFYVRCQDAFGNYNNPEYIIDICTREGPDKTAPMIISTTPLNNAFVAFNQTNKDITILVNEKADCKWSKNDKNYTAMENQFSCNLNNLFWQCNTNLTNLTKGENTFYFRCKDHPEWQGTANESNRNVNIQSYVYKLKVPSTPLTITKIQPNGTFTYGSEPISLNLQAETSGGAENGKAVCSWVIGNWYDIFRNTGSNVHKASLTSMRAGEYKLDVVCVDAGFNYATSSTNFNLQIDNSVPYVTRVYNSQGLYIFTNENSECAYSTTDKNCGFIFENASQMQGGFTQEHFAEWNTQQNYYIKCRDAWKNEPFGCSIKVRAYSIV